MWDENRKKLVVVHLLIQGGTFYFYFLWLTFITIFYDYDSLTPLNASHETLQIKTFDPYTNKKPFLSKLYFNHFYPVG